MDKEEINALYTEMHIWLTMLGYYPVYANHPNELIREFHYMKDGIRVIYIRDSNPYCYLSYDILTPIFNYTIRSQRFQPNTIFAELLSEFKLQISKLK